MIINDWNKTILFLRTLFKEDKLNEKTLKLAKESGITKDNLRDLIQTYIEYKAEELNLLDYSSEVEVFRLVKNRDEAGTAEYILYEESKYNKGSDSLIVISIVKALDDFNSKLSSIVTSKIDETSSIDDFDLDSLVEEFNNKSEAKGTESKIDKFKDYKKCYKPLGIICLVSLFIYLISKPKK